MGLLRGIGLVAGAAAVGAVLFARRQSAATGRDIAEIMADLPDELKKAGAELKVRARESLSIARKAAAEREAEIDRLIEAEEDRLTATSCEQEEIGPGDV